jgi:hypothetical protein
MTKVSPALSYPELFRVTGPLLSLVFRTEDVWQRYNQYTETFQSLNQGFPFSLLQCTPVGPKDYVREYVRNKCGTICKDIDQMRVCADPLIRYQLHALTW